MREIHDSRATMIQADPVSVFDLITDPKRLPDWNAAVERFVDGPTSLTAGVSWTVQMHPSRLMRWKSVSTVQTVDHDSLRFSYRTVNADGNPSYTLWHWEVVPRGHEAEVSVRWDVHLRTVDRRWVAGPIRRRQLRKEVVDSLEALGALVSSSRR